MKNVQYPIGKFQPQKKVTSKDISTWVDEIKTLPQKLKEAVSSISNEQLDTSYRDGGWTIRQVVHHIADSHLNGYIRIKLALTEDHPVIKPYNQESWAQLPDNSMPVESSLDLIDGLHKRWAYLLKSMDEDQLKREFIHPEDGTLMVKDLIELYAWHSRHHLAHITTLIEQKNWD